MEELGIRCVCPTPAPPAAPDSGERTCYKCGKTGHIQPNCQEMVACRPQSNQALAAPFSASQQSQIASLNPAIASLTNRTEMQKFADMLARKIAEALENENKGKECNSGENVGNGVV